MLYVYIYICIHFDIAKFNMSVHFGLTWFSFSLLDFSSVEPVSSNLMEIKPLEWPERHVLQNLETFEKAKQKTR